MPSRKIVPRLKSLSGRLSGFTTVAAFGIVCAPSFGQVFTPNNLVVSRSVYAGNAATVAVGESLPPTCGSQASCTGRATDDGSFPSIGSTNNVWNNATFDGSFGITSPIFLDEITTGGTLLNTVAIPTSGANSLVTSFNSKSELALNLSLDGKYITFMGYVAPPNTLDVSSGNTPGLIDPTNPSASNYYRGVAQVDASGDIEITETNAYSGGNGRAAIYTGDPNGLYFAVGNDNNGSQPTDEPYTPVLTALMSATGVQIVRPLAAPEAPLQAGSYSITEQGDQPDQPGKDNDFRGLTIFNNTLYVTKGSGSNGIDTVYQVGNPGTLPVTGGGTISILPGFFTTLKKKTIYPFGIWFANSTTLYVGDEGYLGEEGGGHYPITITPYAGLQKWSLVSGEWIHDYTLTNGLNLGQPYNIPNYPESINPATVGLRNITGRVNADGTATIWAITSTVSANGDQGADPNLLVAITDDLANTSSAAAGHEQFTIVKAAGYGEVLRGVAFTPGSTAPPAPGSIVVTSSALVYSRATKTYSGTLTITNDSSNAIGGTVTVALTNLTAGVTLNGSTFSPNGYPEVIFPAATLEPGQSANQSISFSDPSNARILFTPVVVSAP